MAVSVESLQNTEIYPRIQNTIDNSGWINFEMEDVREILTGSERLSGYFQKKGVSLRDLGFDVGGILEHGSGYTRQSYIGEHEAEKDYLPGNGRSFLVEFADRYRAYCKGRRIVFKVTDGNTSEWVQCPYTYRGSRGYTARIRKKVQTMGNRWGSSIKGVAFTLTPRGWGNPFNRFLELKNNLNKFLTWLFKRRVQEENKDIKRINKKRKKWGGEPLPLSDGRIDYIWSIEPTKRGYAHFHFVLKIKDWKDLIPDITEDPDETNPMMAKKNRKKGVLKEIRDWWQMQGVDIDLPGLDLNNVKKDFVAYIMKYITKSHKSDEWNALMTITRKRSWGATRSLTEGGPDGGEDGLVQDLEEVDRLIPTKKWEYVGTFTKDFIEYMKKNLLEHDPSAEDIREIGRYYDHPYIEAELDGLEPKDFGRI